MTNAAHGSEWQCSKLWQPLCHWWAIRSLPCACCNVARKQWRRGLALNESGSDARSDLRRARSGSPGLHFTGAYNASHNLAPTMSHRSRYFRKMQVAPTRTQMMNRPSASGRPGISPGSGVKRTSAQLACSACITARQWLLPEPIRL